MAIAQAQLGATNNELVEVPAGKSYAITTIMVCNKAGFNSAGTNDTSFNLHFIKSGDPKSDTNMVCKELPVAGGDTFTLDEEKIILEAGDKVLFDSQAPLNLTVTVSYLEV